MPSIRRTGKRREIAQRIRRRREALGLIQEDVAKTLRIDRQQWAYIEQGQQSLPIERLAEVCAILKWTPDELLGIATAELQPQQRAA